MPPSSHSSRCFSAGYSPKVVSFRRVWLLADPNTLEFFGRVSDYADEASLDNSNGSLYTEHFRVHPYVAYL